MKRTIGMIAAVAAAGATLVGIGAGIALAHQCPEGDTSSPECRDTETYDDWRPNYVPLFDLSEREYGDPSSAEEQRRDAQRWREECNNGDQERQQCAWVYGGTSVRDYPSDDPSQPLPRPNELHVGYAANHCFLAEAAHDCDGHGDDEFGTHDSHGGAVYADVCLSANPDSKYCRQGLRDTQLGVTVVDHLTCPTGCFDEYHVIRPFDSEYTQRQMENSVDAAGRIAADPQRHLCGYEQAGSRC